MNHKLTNIWNILANISIIYAFFNLFKILFCVLIFQTSNTK